MPDLPNPPIEQPVQDPVTGRFNPEWIRWLAQLTEIIRGL